MAIVNDIQIGYPGRIFSATITVVESLTGLVGGEIAFATDTFQLGFFNGTSWIWGNVVPSGSYVKTDGTTPLTADWDVGAGNTIKCDLFEPSSGGNEINFSNGTGATFSMADTGAIVLNPSVGEVLSSLRTIQTFEDFVLFDNVYGSVSLINNSGDLNINIGATTEVFVTSSGLGVGVDPSVALDVIGDAEISGNISATNTDAHMALTTTAHGGIREKLSAARTYYVRIDGSDSNTGLVDSAGGAFLTIQKAIDTVAELDINGQTTTIQIRDGTFAENLTLKNVAGFSVVGNLIIQGNSSTPTNVVVGAGSGIGIVANYLSVVWDLKDFKVSSGTGSSIRAYNSALRFSGLDFASSSSTHVIAESNSVVLVIGNYTISGGAARHWYSLSSSQIVCQSRTITLSGTPNFSTAFAVATNVSGMQVNGNTFSGGATGSYYSVTLNGVINTSGGGATYFPGNSAGTTATGGQYA